MPLLILLPLALAAGLLLALGFAPYSLAWAPLVALAAIFALVSRLKTAGAVLSTGYSFGLGYAGLGVHWIYYSIADYGGGPLAAGIATAVLVALFALIPMVALWLGWLVGQRRRRLAALVSFPLAWVLVEWVRSWLFTGATWLSVGYSQIDTPLAQFAPVLGVYGPGLALALLAGALAWWLRRPWSWRLLLPPLMAIVLVGGGLVLDRDWSRASGEPLSVALLQGNIDQARKWDPAERGSIFAEYIALTRSQWGEDLIIWPETALPVFYHQAEPQLQQLAEQAKLRGSTLVMGAPMSNDQGAFNAVVIPGDSPQFYYKRHLVPFGEYVPFRDWAGGLLNFVGTPLGDFNAGTSAQPLQAAGHALGVSICYEVTFGAELADSLPAAEILLNVSNDAWFGRSAAPWQHLQMARMRALETARPLLRATNTGISAVIDQRGGLRMQTPLFEQAVLNAQVTPRTGMTPYMRWRDWPIAGLCLSGLVLMLIFGRRELTLFRDIG